MGDDTSTQPQLRQRRNKIIIRKCKKPTGSKQSSLADDDKKVNGDLSSTENKGKEDDDVVVIKTVVEGKGELNTLSKGKKRKLSASEEENDVVVIEDSAKVEKQDENEGKDNSFEDSQDLQAPEKQNQIPKIVKISKTKKKAIANGKKGNKSTGDDSQNDSQAEYAQYLGLQPTMQFKCYRCGEKGFPSMLALNMHQRICEITQKSNFLSNLQQDTSSTDPNMLTNFRITRKVYLCSACGTYYENWNLFLHMRDVHKKHICLFCLLLFPAVDKLADHLQNAHSVEESTFKSKEDFGNTYKGSCYLVCCSCERMFEETEEYSNHQCVRVERMDPTAKCNLCGVKCGHYYTCPNNNQSRAVTTVTNTIKSLPITKAQSSATITKFGVPGSSKKVSEEIWMGKKGTSYHEDDYDISHVASFCHVDIADESGGKDKIGTEENPVELSDDELKDSSSDPQKDPNSEPSTSKSQLVVEEKKETSEVLVSRVEQVSESVKTNPEDNVSSSETDKEDKDIEGNNKLKENSNEGLRENAEQNKDLDKEGSEQTVSPVPNLEKSTEEKETETKRKDNFENSLSQEQSLLEANKNLNSDVDKLKSPVQKDFVLSDSDGEPADQLSGTQSSDECSKRESEKSNSKLPTESSNIGDMNESSSKQLTDELNENMTTFSNENKASGSNDESKNESPKQDSSVGLSTTNINESSKDFNLADIIGVNSSVIELNRGKVVKSRKKKPVKVVTKKKKPIKSEENSTSNLISEDPPSQVTGEMNDGIPLASEDVLAMALALEDKLEDASPQSIIKECVRTSCLNCVYCSHAVKIAVNGKQLALHLLAEHRYKPIKNNETTQDVIKKLKNSLKDLEQVFFNTDSYDSSDKSLNATYDYTYECFQCRFVAKVHKDLYSHKRKMHQKVVMLCIMCKSNFFSYSELLCHMCPGVYASNNISFRCCFCNLDMIPSAFRLMVHLRKSHHTCDICLEVAEDQQKLSIHMWKHKLNHMCYRCGIAYRNKPDITKHLFWKHGTESVLCKKCLQKKWPHVYHFCIPPTVFICEECNTSFSKAVALKVHKRFHSGELLYECSKCELKFVSRKLQKKHEEAHDRPIENLPANQSDPNNKIKDSTEEHINVESVDEPDTVGISSTPQDSKVVEEKVDTSVEGKQKKKKKKDRKNKNALDVYDLPPLNLSSESDSSDEETKPMAPDNVGEKKEDKISETVQASDSVENPKTETNSSGQLDSVDDNLNPPPVVDGVWDNFQTYKAELEKREIKDSLAPNSLPSTSEADPITPLPITQPSTSIPPSETKKVIEKTLSAMDWLFIEHNYCAIPGKPKPTNIEEEAPETATDGDGENKTEVSQATPVPRGHSSSIDHAYATPTATSGEAVTAESIEKPDGSAEEPPNTPVKQVIPSTDNHSSKKKKQKTPKKKKTNTHSSSSSDSSSDSDSSSCSSKCSGCSVCSGSSSSSSDSDSESSPGDKEKSSGQGKTKNEKVKHKHQKDGQIQTAEAPPPPLVEEEPIVDAPSEPIQLPVRESDLDTEESSTDEDFYDKYPQNHAKEQMEKRNLMLLASVAPTNNGPASPIRSPLLEKSSPPQAIKQKVKTKKRRKSQQSKKTSNKSPKSIQQPYAKPSTSMNLPMASSTPSFGSSNYQSFSSKVSSPLRTPVTAFHSDATGGSGSENDSARLSKRKRVRNKFYGYSSEEEEELQDKSSMKWRKVEPPPQPYFPPSSYQPPTPTVSYKPQVTIPQARRPKPSESSGSDDEPPLRIHKEDTSSSSRSSSSSDSESELDSKPNAQKVQTEKSDNLYCYCQCPYDEVSEMIACDGEDCTIEWFHFECVGIMVPPKGKWFCPDCRKRKDIM